MYLNISGVTIRRILNRERNYIDFIFTWLNNINKGVIFQKR